MAWKGKSKDAGKALRMGTAGIREALFTPLVSITMLDCNGQTSGRVYLPEEGRDSAVTAVGRGLGSWKAFAGERTCCPLVAESSLRA